LHIFIMGIDLWRDEQSWPLHDTRFVDYHLDGRGAANTAGGNGLLTIGRQQSGCRLRL